MLRAVIFDFDGTLVDSYPAITASVNHVRASLGLPPLDEATVRRHVGRGPEYLLTHAAPGSDFARDWPLYQAHHPSVLLSHTTLLPGALECLTALRQSFRALAICSNKPRLFTRRLVDHLGLAELISVIVGPEDAARPKPAADMLLTTLLRLNVQKHEALYVGDMRVDIETARSAGVAVWVVPTGSDERSDLEAAKPDRLFNSLHELPDLIAQS
jgi:phosphoglycolate phosphatase